MFSQLLTILGLALSITAQAAATSTGNCPTISPGPLALNQLADLPLSAKAEPDIEQAIRNTLALYVYAIDGRRFDIFNRIFVDNVRTNYSEPLNEIIGVENLKTTLAAGLNNFALTHHLLGSTYIFSCGRDTAISVTYYTASHFFLPSNQGDIQSPQNVLYATARYEDSWKKQKDGSWKIINRNNVYSGPMITAAAVSANPFDAPS